MRVRIIDAFTDRSFAGNPAGVCLLDVDAWPDAAWMQRIAAELGHETAFAYRLEDDTGADWALRWFTPAGESNVCGHATLATVHAPHTDLGGPLTVRFASPFASVGSSGTGTVNAQSVTSSPINGRSRPGTDNTRGPYMPMSRLR